MINQISYINLVEKVVHFFIKLYEIKKQK